MELNKQCKMAIQSIRHLEEIGRELDTKVVYLPPEHRHVISINEFIFENFILTKRFDVVNANTLRYITSQGITLYIEQVSEEGNTDDEST